MPKSPRHNGTRGKFKNLVPAGTKHYIRETLVFTDHAQDVILDLIASGERQYVACQIAGVKQATFSGWLERGKHCTDTTDAYYRFYTRYQEARLRGLKILREHQRKRREDPQGYGDEPVTTMHNPLPLSLFTEETQQSILSYLRAGTFPSVAAEACGVPTPIFLYWMDEGRKEIHQQVAGEFTAFYLECMKIAAQARASAETRVYDDMPLAWLLHGPGRDAPERPGWTKQSQVTGPSGGPVQIQTEWRVAEAPRQVEGSLQLEIPAERNGS